ncbi:MAG: KOW domain-containing RNA-binding protein [Clostridia bacterium]|nr:KOW domain-containing RNA-binding protein [Clostridia bacterium]
MDITVGSAVYARAGKEKGGLFFVVKLEGDFAYLSDGDTRRIEKPKKKRLKHLNKTNYVSEEISEHCRNGSLENHILRKALAQIKPI